MQLSIFFQALVMLCGLASVVFVTLDVRPRAQAAVAAGFVIGAAAVRPARLPEPVWVGGLVAALCVAALMRPRASVFVAGCGGVLAGMWIALLQVAGAPLAAAAALAAAPIALSAVFTRRRPEFAPPALREEALLLVLLLGLVVAVAPGVAAGWQSAASLNLQPQEVASQVVPAWTLLVTLGATALGGLYTVWMRR